MLDNKSTESWTSHCSEKETEVKGGESLTPFMEKEHVHQGLRAEDSRYRTKDAAQQARNREKDIVSFSCHSGRPDATAHASYQAPKDDRTTAKYVCQWNDEERTRRNTCDCR